MKLPRVRILTLRVQDGSLFENLKLRGRENQILMDLLNDIRNGPVKPIDLENKYSISVWNLLRKLINSGMIAETENGYVLSTEFAEKLRKFALEWEVFVREGEWEVEG
ncbi:hypothetical protein [Geoglobus ahangari]